MPHLQVDPRPGTHRHGGTHPGPMVSVKDRPKSNSHPQARPHGPGSTTQSHQAQPHQARCLTNWKHVPLKKLSVPTKVPVPVLGEHVWGFCLCLISFLFRSSQTANQKTGPKEAQEKGRAGPTTELLELAADTRPDSQSWVREQGPLSEPDPFVPLPREETI